MPSLGIYCLLIEKATPANFKKSYAYDRNRRVARNRCRYLMQFKKCLFAVLKYSSARLVYVQLLVVDLYVCMPKPKQICRASRAYCTIIKTSQGYNFDAENFILICLNTKIFIIVSKYKTFEYKTNPTNVLKKYFELIVAIGYAKNLFWI